MLDEQREKINSSLIKAKRFARVAWAGLWIRKDEFHKSLDLDADAMHSMSAKGEKAYLEDLMRRRNRAHERDLDN